MRRLAATTLALAVLAPATAAAAPAPVDRLRADGIAFALSARAKLTPAGEAQFAFTARPPAGDTGPYGAGGDIGLPAVGVAARRALLVGTGIGCGPPAATAVFGTVRKRARRVVATTTGGETYRLRRVPAPKRWDFGGWVVGRIIGGEAPVARVEAFARGGRSLATAEFGDPPACPAR